MLIQQPSRRPLQACTPQLIADLTAVMHHADFDDDNNDDSVERALWTWHHLLAGLDPATAADNGILAEAIVAWLQFGVLDNEQECAWLHYAYHVHRRLYDKDDEACANAATAYADALHRDGRPDEALPVQHHAADLYRRAGDLPALLSARARYARLLHATGCCKQAAEEIAVVWLLWRHDESAGVEEGTRVIDAYLSILLGCRRLTDARRLLDDIPSTLGVGDLCSDAHLPIEAAEHTPLLCTWSATAKAVA